MPKPMRKAVDEFGGAETLRSALVDRVRDELRVRQWSLDKLAESAAVPIDCVLAFDRGQAMPTKSQLNNVMWSLDLSFDGVMPFAGGALSPDSRRYWKTVRTQRNAGVLGGAVNPIPDELDLEFFVREQALNEICEAAPELPDDVLEQRSRLRRKYDAYVRR